MWVCRISIIKVEGKEIVYWYVWRGRGLTRIKKERKLTFFETTFILAISFRMSQTRLGTVL